MRVFVTGASGFVGGAVVEEAVRRGYEVLAMSRSERSDDKISALGAKPVRCSLGNVASEHMSGCEAVIHSAAYVEEWGSRKDFWEANVDGTRHVLEAAKRAGVKRFIHVGTEAVLFRGQNMLNVNEETPYPDSTPFLYSETKRAAEELVVQGNGDGLETVSIRPRLIWGPGDQSVLPALLGAIRANRFLWIDGGNGVSNMTHIYNLRHAIFLALEAEKSLGGEIFFVTDDEEQTFREFFTRLLRTQGVSMSFPSAPGWLVRSAAVVIEGVWRMLGVRSAPPLTRFGTNIISRSCTINIDKIKRELGYQPVIDMRTGMKEMPRL